jgi:hypothetical protein
MKDAACLSPTHAAEPTRSGWTVPTWSGDDQHRTPVERRLLKIAKSCADEHLAIRIEEEAIVARVANTTAEETTKLVSGSASRGSGRREAIR